MKPCGCGKPAKVKSFGLPRCEDCARIEQGLYREYHFRIPGKKRIHDHSRLVSKPTSHYADLIDNEPIDALWEPVRALEAKLKAIDDESKRNRNS